MSDFLWIEWLAIEVILNIQVCVVDYRFTVTGIRCTKNRAFKLVRNFRIEIFSMVLVEVSCHTRLLNLVVDEYWRLHGFV